MNFDEVKSITIPEGDVKSLKINGVEVFKKKTGFNIDDYEINEYLSIKSANFKTSYVLIGKIATLYTLCNNVGVAKSVIVIDELTHLPVDLIKSGMFIDGKGNEYAACTIKAELPKGERFFTSYLLDADNKRSPEGMTASITIR